MEINIIKSEVKILKSLVKYSGTKIGSLKPKRSVYTSIQDKIHDYVSGKDAVFRIYAQIHSGTSLVRNIIFSKDVEYSKLPARGNILCRIDNVPERFYDPRIMLGEFSKCDKFKKRLCKAIMILLHEDDGLPRDTFEFESSVDKLSPELLHTLNQSFRSLREEAEEYYTRKAKDKLINWVAENNL